MSYILGISAYYHDSACCLIYNGKIINAVQEERFSRIKNDSSFPKESIKWILLNNNIFLKDISSFVFYEKPFLKFERIIESYTAFAPKGFKSFSTFIPEWITKKIFLKDLINKELINIENNKKKNNIYFSEHHMSHAASAFYPSPFEKSAVLTLDGVGEWDTSTIGIGNKNDIKILEKIHYPHSLGLLYSAFTYYLGFKVNEDEYKVMGLAPYGKPVYTDIIFKNLIDLKNDGSFRLNLKFFNYATGFTMTNKNFSKLFGKNIRKNNETITEFHMNIASSIQKVTEIIIIRICEYIKKKYKLNNLCVAGGVGLNCVANGLIKKLNLFDNIWIQPASGDAGGALGAALSYYYQHEGNLRKISNKDSMNNSYLGPRYNNEEIKKDFISNKISFEEYKDERLLEYITNEIQKGKIIGWMQGSLEFGPRALGNRSIIADPRNEEMQKRLNLKTKFRESFRPFAPIVLEEQLSDWFDLDTRSPYMLLVAQVKKNKLINVNSKKNHTLDDINEKRSQIPSVTHVDMSARIQTISKENGKIYDLLKLFYKKTNCPVLINTSFNLSGEPIVSSHMDAYQSFMVSDIDILVCENLVIKKFS
tara:strand:- start:1895 stop:3670 length:1776 start_codon:yes stop_codon:yes gene_type:complete